jgi:hypothetical protein
MNELRTWNLCSAYHFIERDYHFIHDLGDIELWPISILKSIEVFMSEPELQNCPVPNDQYDRISPETILKLSALMSTLRVVRKLVLPTKSMSASSTAAQ